MVVASGAAAEAAAAEAEYQEYTDTESIGSDFDLTDDSEDFYNDPTAGCA